MMVGTRLGASVGDAVGKKVGAGVATVGTAVGAQVCLSGRATQQDVPIMLLVPTFQGETVLASAWTSVGTSPQS